MKAVSELDVQRETTRNFINAFPTPIALTRHTRSASGTGGFETTATQQLAEQDFALLGSQSQTAPQARTEQGEITQLRIFMLGLHDADIQEGDTFTLTSGSYRVEFVHPDRSYRTFIEVVYEGSA